MQMQFDLPVLCGCGLAVAHVHIVFQELQGPGFASNSNVKPRLQPSPVTRSHSNIPSSQSTVSFLSHVSSLSCTIRDANDTMCDFKLGGISHKKLCLSEFSSTRFYIYTFSFIASGVPDNENIFLHFCYFI